MAAAGEIVDGGDWISRNAAEAGGETGLNRPS